MSEPSVHPAQLQDWFRRIKAGDRSARDEMLRAISGRLDYLARKMLRRFPNVRRYADTEDILQSSLVRLLRTLEKVQPTTMRHLVNLAAVQIRRELIDLARYFGSRPRFVGSGQEEEPEAVKDEPADVPEEPEDLDRWTAFHTRVECLSAEEREVVSLIFYHGWTHAEVAELFHVSDRTVRRRWDAALAKLHGLLRDEQPEA
jgi:RNA polymerase sigma factor (sigma-70 family)